MSPFTPAPDRLTDDQRSCLLRAARKQLLALEDEYNRLVHIANDAASPAADSAALELRCVQAGVAWLWRDQVPGDK